VIQEYCWSPIVWRNGEKRQVDFVSADFLVYDVDDPSSPPMAQASKIWCEHLSFVGPTKSHQVSKHGIVCDRYRAGVKTDITITDFETYKYNAKMIADRYGGDPSCADGAQFFWPCQGIASRGAGEEYWTVKEAPRPEIPRIFSDPRRPTSQRGMIGENVMRILRDGVPERQRDAAYFVACCLKDCGLTGEEILAFCRTSKIALLGGEDEWRETIANAFKYGRNNGRGKRQQQRDSNGDNGHGHPGARGNGHSRHDNREIAETSPVGDNGGKNRRRREFSRTAPTAVPRPVLRH
jgi:hypothetical protein